MQYDSTLLPALEKTIRELHHMVGNVNPDGYYVLPGYGGTGAALYVMAAIARMHGTPENKIKVFAQKPYFPVSSIV